MHSSSPSLDVFGTPKVMTAKMKPKPLATCVSSSSKPNWFLRKDKRQKINMQKAGVRWAGCSNGDTTASSTSSKFIIYSGKQGGGTTVLGERCDIAVIGNKEE
jgi:hypothetical protein